MTGGEKYTGLHSTTSELGTPATYNFHNLFSVRVAHRGLAFLIKRELAMFLTDPEEVDLVVEEGDVALPPNVLTLSHFYDDSKFVFETESGRVEIRDGEVRAEAAVDPEYLLVRWVENLMRRQVLLRGAAFVHASAVAREGTGYLFPAWAHTGKTNVALTFLKAGYDYMADDWCFVDSSGDIRAYPRWLNLFDYNFRCHQDLVGSVSSHKEWRDLRRRLGVGSFVESLSGRSRIAGRLGRWLSERYFVRAQVPASIAVQGCRVALSAPLSKVCLIASSRAQKVDVSDASPEEVARKVALCGYYERTPFRRYLAAMAYADRQLAFPDPVSIETELLTRTFESAKCLEVVIPSNPKSADLVDLRHLLEDA